MVRLVASNDEIKMYAKENKCSQKVARIAIHNVSGSFHWSERIEEEIENIKEYGI